MRLVPDRADRDRVNASTTQSEIARISVENERPSTAIGYETATPFAIGFWKRHWLLKPAKRNLPMAYNLPELPLGDE
jgi:hypothetical protein